MDKRKPPRVVILSGSNEWPGMFAAEIIKEDIELVGVILDRGKHKTQPTTLRHLPSLRLLKMQFLLLLKFPYMYRENIYRKVYRLFGHIRPSIYQRMRRKEEKLYGLIYDITGRQYRQSLMRHRRFPLLNEVAENCGVKFHEVDNVNSREAAQILRKLRPEFCIGMGMRIIRSNILTIPKLGILNCHCSLLPEYRGGTTEFWQIANGEKETGVTIHWMDDKVDAGRIVAQGRWCILPGSDHFALRMVSNFERLPIWRQAIRMILNNEASKPQGVGRTSTFRHPTLSHQYNFYVKGLRTEQEYTTGSKS